MVDLNSTKKEKKGKETSSDSDKQLLDQLKRLQAEFINYQKRTEQEKAQFMQYGKEQAIKDIIDIFENFERAKDCIDKGGIELIYKQFQDILNKNQIQEIQTNGKYNPELHEVMCKDQSKEDEDTIIEVFQKGYTINGKLLKPSKVKVSGGNQNE
ncbi:MAG: nucleotide exchange factor GrpE [archaeon]